MATGVVLVELTERPFARLVISQVSCNVDLATAVFAHLEGNL